MSWAALIRLLLEFLGPIIREWIEELLRRAEPELGTFPGAARPAIAELFAKARGQVWWWQFRRKAILGVCERVALRRAAEFSPAMLAGEGPAMTTAEAKEIVAVM